MKENLDHLLTLLYITVELQNLTLKKLWKVKLFSKQSEDSNHMSQMKYNILPTIKWYLIFIF